MRSGRLEATRATWLAITLLGVQATAQQVGLSQEYCSSDNTGADYNAVHDIYNSNSACYNQCQQSYAFAIVQYQNCWCSNYIPADQQSTGSCDQSCPGYPDDNCGNTNNGLYGYIKLNQQPSGTAGAASSTQASSTEASSTSFSSTPSTTSQATSSPPPTSTETTPSSTPEPTTTTQEESSSSSVVQQTPSSSLSYVAPTTSTYSTPTTTSTSIPPSTSSTTTPYVAPIPATTEAPSTSARYSATPTPVISVRVTTISGSIVTQTVTSTPSVAPNSDSDSAPLQRKGLSAGAIAGAVIGSLLGVAALLLGAFLLWRRKQRNDDAEGKGSFHGPNSPRRNASVLSKAGLLGRGRAVSMGEKDYEYPYSDNNHTGNNSVRHSMLYAAGGLGEGVSPVSPLGSAHDGSDGGRRHSKPMVYDQRLNPSALFANAEATGSRISMQDTQDYSRPLGIANPDVRPSFESRHS